MKFLLDSNTLIEAKNRYYQMNVCPGYWTWVLKANGIGNVSSIESVGDELRAGNDDLAQWAKDNAHLFLDESDEATQAAFAEVAEHVAGLAHLMKVGALESFLAKADPWLIAKAQVMGATVVTHEQRDPANRRKFLIPNVCDHFGVKTMDTFELLGQLEAKFILAE